MEIPRLHMEPFGQSVLRRDYASRQNTNTAPVYGNESVNRCRSKRLPNGMSYSVHRARHQAHHINNIYGRPSPKTEEPRSRQPGHNQTEQARRHKETQLFNQIQAYSDFDEIRPIRNLYSDKDCRSSESKGTVRLTKKVLLNTTHSAVRVDRGALVKNLADYRQELIKLIEHRLENCRRSPEFQELEKIKRNCCKVRNCQRCDQRFTLQQAMAAYPSSHRRDHAIFTDQQFTSCGLSAETPHHRDPNFINDQQFTSYDLSAEIYDGPVIFDNEDYPCSVAKYEECGSDFPSNPSGASSSVGDFN